MPWAAKSSDPFMNENLVLGIISVALCAYLLFAMVRPEKF
jgi:K+-transporting ATPase KdpF subunit